MSERLRGASVVLLPDNDEPGWKHINNVGASLAGIASRVRVLVLPGLSEKGDIRDWLAAGGKREQLDALVETAPDWQPPPEKAPPDKDKAKAATDEQALVDALARLNAVDYDRRRDEAADQMRVRRGTLDNQVNARRRELAEEKGPAPLFGHWLVEPWPEPVHAGELLLAIVERIKRHVVLADEQAVAVALWALFTWVHEAAAVHSPILLATSAEANSGKTTLINVVRFLAPRSLVCAGISEAALFRVVEKYEPTIIVDEADVILVENEPLRAVINGGWTRGFSVVRCVGDDIAARFPNILPKGARHERQAVSSIQRSAARLSSRCGARKRAIKPRTSAPSTIPVLPNCDAERSAGRSTTTRSLKTPSQICRRASIIGSAITGASCWPLPTPPAASGRRKRGRRPSSCPRSQTLLRSVCSFSPRSRRALTSMVSNRLSVSAPPSWPRRSQGADASSPFSEWKGGKPITQAQLARALKPFGIAPEVTRLPGGGRLRGYQRSQFADAWERYLPPE